MSCSYSTIVIPESPDCGLKTMDSGLQPTILWLSPQELADIRLQYEIGEMVSGHRSPYRSACHDQRDATHKGSHVTSDG